MSRELEEQLAVMPERWRDQTRTRAYAMLDYEAAGDDAALLVPVLSRRTGLTTSAFYALVRRWRASGRQMASLTPWARRSGTKPRIAAETTAHIDERAGPLIAEDPKRPTEPVARWLVANWPANLPRAGISYIRRRVNHLRVEHEKKTRRVRRAAADRCGDLGGDPRPRPRWPLDVILVDHVAVEAVVWPGDDPTLPLATLAIDLATGRAIGVSVGIVEPTPAGVAAALAGPAALAAIRGAPGPPTILLSTTFAKGWPQLVSALAEAGAKVVTRRSNRLSFGADAARLLRGGMAGYRLAPRLGHRPVLDRASPKAVTTMPSLEIDDLVGQLQATVQSNCDDIMVDESWPDAATVEPDVWHSLSQVTSICPVDTGRGRSKPALSSRYGKS